MKETSADIAAIAGRILAMDDNDFLLASTLSDPSLSPNADFIRDVRAVCASALAQREPVVVERKPFRFSEDDDTPPPLVSEQWVYVKSTYLNRFRYQADRELLLIEFAQGAQFEYEGVPPEIPTSLMQVESPGKFFIAEIQDKFKARKLERPEE